MFTSSCYENFNIHIKSLSTVSHTKCSILELLLISFFFGEKCISHLIYINAHLSSDRCLDCLKDSVKVKNVNLAI